MPLDFSIFQLIILAVRLVSGTLYFERTFVILILLFAPLHRPWRSPPRSSRSHPGIVYLRYFIHTRIFYSPSGWQSVLPVPPEREHEQSNEAAR